MRSRRGGVDDRGGDQRPRKLHHDLIATLAAARRAITELADESNALKRTEKPQAAETQIPLVTDENKHVAGAEFERRQGEGERMLREGRGS